MTKNVGLWFEKSMLRVAMLQAVLYVAVSLSIDIGLSKDRVDAHRGNMFGNSDSVGGVARTCTACHVLNQTENATGPHLVDLIDRKAGAVANFAYSDSMRRAGGRWTRARLKAFLLDPQSVVPGTVMVAPPLSEGTAEAIVNYLSRRH